jgi:hypothetical protein
MEFAQRGDGAFSLRPPPSTASSGSARARDEDVSSGDEADGTPPMIPSLNCV